MTPFFSVCICTRNRPELLGRALDGVLAQTAPAESFEIVVIDNASREDARQAAMGYVRPDRRLRVIPEPVVGISAARNRAAAEAAGEWLAYLDDDAIPEPDWLARAGELVNKFDPDLLGGPFEPYYTSQKPAWFLDRYGAGGYGERGRWLTGDEYLFGANFFIRRKLLLSAGGFPLNLGPRGEWLFYGEETGLQRVLRRQNPDLEVYYAPELAIRHWVAPFKMSISGRLRQRWAEGRAGYLTFRQPGDRFGWKHLAGLAGMPAVIVWRLTAGALLRDRRRFPAWQNYIYEDGLNSVATWGKLFQRLRTHWGGERAK